MNTAKLRGFNYPLTPKGKSTLNPPPPWYYSSDFLDVEFWAQPAAVASLLPNGLEPDPAANGHCNALFYDWQFSGANEEYLDPARYQYREFFILVDALFEGRSYRTAPTFSSIMMLRSRVAGLKVIRSVSGKFSKRGITPRQGTPVPH
jgi:hypothetical protein